MSAQSDEFLYAAAPAARRTLFCHSPGTGLSATLWRALDAFIEANLRELYRECLHPELVGTLFALSYAQLPTDHDRWAGLLEIDARKAGARALRRIRQTT